MKDQQILPSDHFHILILFVDRLQIECISMIRIVHEVHDNEIRFRRLIDDIPQRSASPVVTRYQD